MMEKYIRMDKVCSNNIGQKVTVFGNQDGLAPNFVGLIYENTGKLDFA